MFVTFDIVIMPVFHPETRGFNTIPGNLRFDTVSHRAVLSVRVDPSLQDLQVAAIECYAVFFKPCLIRKDSNECK